MASESQLIKFAEQFAGTVSDADMEQALKMTNLLGSLTEENADAVFAVLRKNVGPLSKTQKVVTQVCTGLLAINREKNREIELEKSKANRLEQRLGDVLTQTHTEKCEEYRKIMAGRRRPCANSDKCHGCHGTGCIKRKAEPSDPNSTVATFFKTN